ncbi:hypothetical protein GGD61_007851 [Bradyrhizobium sp. SBR1B]|nr:hypothetical protein [Bradyrhizobium sp. SBR1B]MBB4397186.1 hypothetical protein [Bradyrhizobium sp. ERR14]
MAGIQSETICPLRRLGEPQKATAVSGAKSTLLKSNWRSGPSYLRPRDEKLNAESKPAGYG